MADIAEMVRRHRPIACKHGAYYVEWPCDFVVMARLAAELAEALADELTTGTLMLDWPSVRALLDGGEG